MRGFCIFCFGWIVALAAMSTAFGGLPLVAGLSIIVGAWLVIIACLLSKL